MSGRDAILARIRARRLKSAPRPSPYSVPQSPGELVAQFAERARTVHAEVRLLHSVDEIATAVADLLRARNLPAIVHVPAQAPGLGGLTVLNTPPGPDDTALAIAPFAIAETGTLAYPAAADRPASWHFRAGFEIAVLRANDILPHLENVLARLKGALPHTVNLVSGPSRTGDIEQTLELGAHGPKALAILIVQE
ncbi:MAG: LUD domain-containing protein [Rhizomicrobium sp.]